MDYPVKYVFVKNGVVCSAVTIYTENADVTAPDGAVRYEVNLTNPVDSGWSVVEDSNPMQFKPPAVTLNSIGAGGGKKRPPDQQ